MIIHYTTLCCGVLYTSTAYNRGPADSSLVHSVIVASTMNVAVLLIVTPVHVPSIFLSIDEAHIHTQISVCDNYIQYLLTTQTQTLYCVPKVEKTYQTVFYNNYVHQ